MQISYKPVVQACHDFKILIHISKGEEINFKFYLFSLGLSGKIESNLSAQVSKIVTDY